MSVVQGDQPTFREIFRMFYESVEADDNNLSNWAMPIPGGFHCEKQGIWPLVKRYMSGVGLEDFLADSGLSASQADNFDEYQHARRNRNIFYNIAAPSVIQVSETVLMEDNTLLSAVNIAMRSTHSTYMARLPENCSIEVDCDGPATEAMLDIGTLLYDRLMLVSESRFPGMRGIISEQSYCEC